MGGSAQKDQREFCTSLLVVVLSRFEQFLLIDEKLPHGMLSSTCEKFWCLPLLNNLAYNQPMANEEQLAILKSGVDEWNAWRQENRAAKIDLNWADLNEAKLISADLTKADLTHADLSGGNLTEAKLTGAHLTGADLQMAHLNGVNLSRANLSRANLSGANLNQVDLSGAVLNGADLSAASLCSANLNGAVLNGADLGGVVLSGANLQLAVLNGADLSGADLSGADLQGATLYETIFAGTKLTDAHLNDCVYQGPNTLDHRTLEKSGMLSHVFLKGCGLAQAYIDYLPSLLGNAIEFFSCFISYSHEDNIFARRLHDQLQGQGIRCWMDEHQLLPGDNIHERIDRGIKVWDKVLLCGSKNSLTSWWVDNEIETAFVKERRLMKERDGEKVHALIPLNLDGYLFDGWTSGMASQVKSRVAANFIGWETDNTIFERAFAGVLNALKTEDKGRKPEPESKL